MKKYVGRWDNSTGWFEWAGQPVDSVRAAKQQVTGANYASCDVDVIRAILCPDSKWAEGETVVPKAVGQGWILCE